MKLKMGLISGILAFIFLTTLLFSKAEGAVHNYYWVVKETNFTKLCNTSTVLTVNDSFPGPEITANKGDTVFVTLQNDGPYGITIHWHGVRMPRNPWSDGPEYIVQCPVKSGGNFTQEINLSTEEGTLWWHAHSDWSRATVHGSIKVLPTNGSYPYDTPDGDETIIFSSWYKANVMDVLDESLATGGDPDVSDAYTINGEPGDLYDCSSDTMYNYTVETGKTYLFRIINSILNEEMFFAIANHSMTVVGSDGAYVKPFSSDYLFITPGQTMDVLVTANQTASYYYMVLTPFLDTDSSYDNTTSRALLKYKGVDTTPTTIPTPTFPNISDSISAQLFVVQLKSLADAAHPITVPKNISKQIFMTVSVNLFACPNSTGCTVDGNNKLAASLNNNSFLMPTTSLLQDYYDSGYNISSLDVEALPKVPPTPFNYTTVVNMSAYTSEGRQVITLEYGEEVEIVFQGTNIGATQNHPMHLHGYSFYLVGTGQGDFDNATEASRFNLVDPPEVNTVAVPRKGWTAIRFKADNPGVWFMHCHFERHTTWGMATAVIVKNGGTNETTIRPPPSYMPPCS